MKIKTKGRATPADVIIGKNIREARKRAGLTQEALATQIDVRFQQLQKYENGTNRIAASRLMMVAQAVKKPITVFYKGVVL